MRIRSPIALLAVSLSVASIAACGSEDEHEHEAEEFATKAECEAHYEEEGRDQAEIDELCADVPE